MNRFVVYSDGGCRGNPGPGGWGIRVHPPEGSVEEHSGSDPKTTNNRMELMGAIEGLRAVPEGSTVVLITDSQYVVKGMNEWVKGWIRRNWVKPDKKPVLNRDLWEQLVEVSSKRKSSFEWTRGHAGDLENEAVDRLANEAMDQLGA